MPALMTSTSCPVRVWAALSMTLILGACGGGGGGGGGIGVSGSCGGDFDCQALVTDLASGVMLPVVQDFASAAQQLDSLTGAYCSALDTADAGDDTTALVAAQSAWRDAMSRWQHLEVMQVGPLLDNSGALRDNIYSWPTTDSCRVDQDVVLAQEAGYDIASRTPDRRGLAALEYVLFTDTLDHSCPGNISIVSDWNGRADSERLAARCQYVQLAAADVARLSTELETAWTSANGFLDQVANPGGGGRYSSVQEAVNAFSDALFYVEKQTNDTKLALPAGFLRPNSCGDVGTVCPADVESPYAGVSKQNLRDNLLALQQMFLGDNSGDSATSGFYDFFVALGEKAAADRLAADIGIAIDAVDAIPGTLAGAVTDGASGRPLVEEAFNRMKDVTRQLKNQFVVILGLSLPDSSAGDND